jgi:phage protein D
MADRLKVLFDGQPADEGFYGLVQAVEVEENADLPGAIQLTLPIATRGVSGSEDLTLVGDSRWRPYARIAVVVTPDLGRDACIFDGYVLSHKLHVARGTTASSMRIWGQDASCLMNLQERTREWKDKTDGEVANEIFKHYDFVNAPENVKDDSPKHTEREQTLIQRATDAQFLRDRARRNGKLFRVCCGDTAGRNTGYFIKPDLRASASVTLTLNPPGAATVEALDFEWDVARPSQAFAKVLLTGKDAETGDTKESGLTLLDSRSLAAFTGNRYVMEARLTTTADSVDELKQRTASLLREAGWFVKCEGEADLARLRKVLRVATVVQIDGAGKVHSGKYYVWSVRHTITAEAHRMKFVLVRNAVGSP